MTITIAAYAAAVSTLGLGWQIFAWARSRRTHVKVAVSNAVMAGPLGPLHVLAVQATNESEHTVRVTMFGLEANDGSGRQLIFVNPVPGSDLPGQIAPHDSAAGYQPIGSIDGREVDLRKPVIAFIKTSTNQRYRSRPASLVA
jgi:hypothetical protein